MFAMINVFEEIIPDVPDQMIVYVEPILWHSINDPSPGVDL
jgi:hypothetical protein